MSTTTATSLSLKPWSRDRSGEPALSDVLARVNIERGHFRDITEASLQEELAAEGALESSSDDEDQEREEVEGAKERKPPSTRQELFTARTDIYTRLNDAHQEVMLALDMVSLMETKYAPAQGAVTISAALKQVVPTGAMGADIWHRMPKDPAREAQDGLLATKVRVKHLQQSADDLLAAATRLQDNVRKETQFWDQILSITDKGWSVSKMRNQGQRVLGVHFGFSGSAPEFSRRDAAALMTDSQGNINLERSIGTRPKAMRAVIKKGSRIVGCSKLPSLPDVEETTLEARIRHARDSLYDEELYHELIRESRTLTSLGVSTAGDAIAFGTSTENDETHVEFQLVSLDGDNALPFGATNESDHLAQATMLAARMLLGQAHREKIKSKSQLPPPMTEKKDTPPPFPLIRPLMLLFNHCTSIEKLNEYVQNVAKLLKKVQVDVSSAEAKLKLPMTTSDGNVDTESLVNTLLQPLTAEASIRIESGDEVFTFKLLITTSPNIPSGSAFALLAPSGTRHDLSCIEDISAVANELIASTVAQDVYVRLGLGWMFNSRDGILTREVAGEQDSKDKMIVCIDDGKSISLVVRGSRGNKKITWEVDGDERAIEDAWEEISK